MLRCPHPPTGEERRRLRATARADAEQAESWLIYTDGLGVLGVGSWSDGSAAIKQAEFDRVFKARRADAE